ncbi:MAG: DUF4381 domain-containing protein [Pseudomonadota bacterium]
MPDLPTTSTPLDLPPIRDIRGLDPVSWWPPGIGWWLLGLTILLLVGVMAWLAWRYLPAFNHWRRDARIQLVALRRHAPSQPPKKTASELSELLRRIAMARLGRAACASLTGMAWLAWLERHDPQGFAWTGRGLVLLNLPYAPPEQEGHVADLLALIDATQTWIRESDG